MKRRNLRILAAAVLAALLTVCGGSCVLADVPTAAGTEKSGDTARDVEFKEHERGTKVRDLDLEAGMVYPPGMYYEESIPDAVVAGTGTGSYVLVRNISEWWRSQGIYMDDDDVMTVYSIMYTNKDFEALYGEPGTMYDIETKPGPEYSEKKGAEISGKYMEVTPEVKVRTTVYYTQYGNETKWPEILMKTVFVRDDGELSELLCNEVGVFACRRSNRVK